MKYTNKAFEERGGHIIKSAREKVPSPPLRCCSSSNKMHFAYNRALVRVSVACI